MGTLADSEFLVQLKQTAEKNDAHLHLLAGAIAGIDGISAAKEGGLQKVTYKGCKSPKSWKGSYAEQLVDLDHVSEPTVFLQELPVKLRPNFQPMPTLQQRLHLQDLVWMKPWLS